MRKRQRLSVACVLLHNVTCVWPRGMSPARRVVCLVPYAGRRTQTTAKNSVKRLPRMWLLAKGTWQTRGATATRVWRVIAVFFAPTRAHRRNFSPLFGAPPARADDSP